MTAPQPSHAGASRPPNEPDLPARIGERYHVIEQLGRGGMAVVYRVRDLGQGHELALKQLTLHSAERDRDARAQFEREFYLLAQLSHPSVIQVYDYGVEAQQPYYTMELLDGGDLTERAGMDVHTLCELMLQLCSSLSLLHSRRLVHRDISPRNVRCTLGGRAKLIDFGALLPMGPCEQSVGTPGFVAPEVVHHLAIDARTDLFSLGATLYFALTGKKPFAARTLADLNELWREAPAPPSHHVPRIPAALDALVLSLLQIDPARRPQSAFEVMQRLTAIAGIAYAEPELIAQSYLSTPALIAREPEQRRFRQQLRRAFEGHGCRLFFEGEPGSGRTRLLDVCEIEAKLGGATVVRVNGRTSSGTPLGAAHHIAEQVMLQLPVLATSCAQRENVATTLLNDATAGGIKPLSQFNHDRYQTQTDLCTWLRAVCERKALVIAVDDIERLDDASLGWLAALAHASHDKRLLIMAGADALDAAPTRSALDILRSQALVVPLPALSSEQTVALFTSIFFDVPHVALVSHRVHRLAFGNLRESMALVQYMLERRLIRYVDGQWSLPAELALADLPASTEDAVRARVAALPELARKLAISQALAFEGPFTLSDYTQLAPLATQPQRDEALATLVRQGVVVKNDAAYTLSHLGVRACLLANLSDGERAERHGELAELCVISQRSAIIEVHHRLLAGHVEQALDRLLDILRTTSSLSVVHESGVSRLTLAAILERAYALSLDSARPRREAYELNQRLVEIGVTADSTLYARYVTPWLERLELDSGWQDYQRAPHDMPSAERLRLALETAAARHDATPEHERVYPVIEAIKLMAHFVSISVAVASRSRDSRLLAALPKSLEPFAGLSPIIDALLQLALASSEMNAEAQFERARERMLAVTLRLEPLATADVPYLASLRSAVAGAIAAIDVTLGQRSAEHWIAPAEHDPLHRLGALYMRRALCIFEGDAAGAERYRNQAELLSIQTDGLGIFTVRPALELAAYLHTNDLSGIKYVADRIEQLSLKAPGWLPMHHVAQASFERLRGNLTAACTAFERALATTNPDQHDPPPDLDAWVLAATGYVTVLSELGRAAEALTFGAAASAKCSALRLSGAAPLTRACALAQARLGDYVNAIRGIENLIVQRATLRPCMLAPDYEARARIAIWQKDATASAHFVALALEHHAAFAIRSRLLDEAKQAGLTLDVNVSAVEAALANVAPLGNQADSHRALARFAGLTEPSARAQRALELFVESMGVSAGHLYYRNAQQLTCVASLAATPDPALDRFAARYVERQLERAAMTTVFTEMDDAPESSMGTFTNHDGTTYGVAMFGKRADSCAGVIALCGAGKSTRDAELLVLSRAISQYLIEVGDIELE